MSLFNDQIQTAVSGAISSALEQDVPAQLNGVSCLLFLFS